MSSQNIKFINCLERIKSLLIAAVDYLTIVKE